MQDGALLHIGNPIKQQLKRRFGNAGINSRHFPTAWQYRSPGLNPCDFRLWGYLKDVMFRIPITHLAELKERIKQHILNVIPETLQSMVMYAVFRFQLVSERDEQHPVSGNLKTNLMDAFYAIFGLRVVIINFFLSLVI